MNTFTSLNSFYRSGHGTAYVVENDRNDWENLVGQRVLLDGREVIVSGVEPAGERIALLVS